MAKFFIERPIFATVLAILFVIAGLVCLNTLPIAQYPNITPPTVQVTATYPGASAETVAQTIGSPIEQQVNGVEGMLYMSSSSSSTGQYSLTITFEVGTDIDMATILVQNRVNIAQNTLPEAVIQQGITTQKQSTNMALILSLISDNPLYDDLYLTNYAQLNIVNELSRLSGVGGITVFGAGNYSMRVWMDPQEMRIRGITPADVYQAISAQNLEVSAGSVGAQPSDIPHSFQFTLVTRGRLVSAEEFENIILKSNSDGSILRLGDVAEVELGSVSYSVTSLQRGKQTAAIAIYQLPGANLLDVANEVKAKMNELERYFPEGVQQEMILDTTAFVTASIDEVLVTFIETTLLVVLVILLFLQNFRAVIIPTLTIPISLIGTFAVMELMGFSINLLTLFGLVLAIAIVVDDAIVVVENSTRLLNTGKFSQKEAIIEAMREITGPVVAVVLVLSAVFIPTAFIGGISGQLYKQFALTIATATFLSGFNSLSFTPAMCALFLRPQNEEPHFILYRWFNKGYNWVQAEYVKIITYLLRKPIATMAIYVVLTALTFWLFIKWPSTFIPDEDQGYFMVSVQLPPAASLDRTEAISREIDKVLTEIPEISTYLSINGFSMMEGAQLSNTASFFVILKPWSERKLPSQKVTAIIDRFEGGCASIEGAIIMAFSPPAIPGLGATGGLQIELEDRNNLGVGEIQKAIESLYEEIRTEPSLALINSQFEANTPQFFLEFDRDKIQLLGISLSDVFSTLSYYMGSAYVNDFILFDRIYQVRLGTIPQGRQTVEDVLKLSVRNSNGEMVPFTSFMTVREQFGMNLIARYNLYTAAAITAIPASGYSTGESMLGMEQLIENTLGTSFGYEWTGVAYQENASSSSVTLIFALAIIVAILVLAAQYESFTSPIAVVMGLPFALLGVILGCWVMNLPISIYSQIGIILLIALSAKNAILIVEFARDYRKAGKSITEASIEAGRVRLRPILMTSLAFVFGVMPLIFANGAGAESRISLGTAVVFGMAMNTLIGTLFVPNFYHAMQTLQEKFSGKSLKDTPPNSSETSPVV